MIQWHLSLFSFVELFANHAPTLRPSFSKCMITVYVRTTCMNCCVSIVIEFGLPYEFEKVIHACAKQRGRKTETCGTTRTEQQIASCDVLADFT